MRRLVWLCLVSMWNYQKITEICYFFVWACNDTYLYTYHTYITLVIGAINSFVTWLVVKYTPLKNMSSSVGMMNHSFLYEKIKFLFQSPPTSIPFYLYIIIPLLYHDVTIYALVIGSINPYWLVVSTPLKNISQLGWLFPIYGKIKNVPNHQPAYF